MSTRTVHDPFLGRDVQVSDRLKDRLRGKYAVGPVMPNGEPEFGWRQHDTPPIQHEAADYIEVLEAALREAALQDTSAEYNVAYDHGVRAGIEECARLVEGTGLRNPDNIARDIRTLKAALAPEQGK